MKKFPVGMTFEKYDIYIFQSFSFFPGIDNPCVTGFVVPYVTFH